VGRTVLEASELAKSFSGPPLFTGLTLRADAGITAVTGPNGSGKTTLLKILAGLIRPTRGSVRVLRGGEEATGDERRLILGWAGPDLELYGDFTALENLVFFRKLAGMSAQASDLRGRLEPVGLDRHAGRPVREFSTGMKQRLRIAFAMLADPAILLLDEPYAGLDADGRRRVRALIEEQQAGIPVVLASNDTGDFGTPEQTILLGANG
jgi:heme exporter protein A